MPSSDVPQSYRLAISRALIQKEMGNLRTPRVSRRQRERDAAEALEAKRAAFDFDADTDLP